MSWAKDDRILSSFVLGWQSLEYYRSEKQNVERETRIFKMISLHIYFNTIRYIVSKLQTFKK